jgi:hypothetical protein
LTFFYYLFVGYSVVKVHRLPPETSSSMAAVFMLPDQLTHLPEPHFQV